jgi:hypothetical protein
VYFKGALYDVSTSIHFRILIAASEYFCFIASFLYLMFAVLQTEQIREPAFEGFIAVILSVRT